MTARKIYVLHTVQFRTFHILPNKMHKLKYNTFQPTEVPLGHILTVTNVCTHNTENINNCERVAE